MSRRAQTATEYMIILAIVIIIALIVAAVLGEFPGLGGSTRERSSAVFWETTEIGILAYAIAEDGIDDGVTLVLRNNRKYTVTVTDIEFEDESIYSTSTVIASGESTTLSINDAGSYCNNAGGTYNIDVNITYTDERTGESFQETGRGHKLEGKCAN